MIRGAPPPALAEGLLALLLPADERDDVLGDLEENYRIRERHHGRARARAWYWGQALTAPLWIWGERGSSMISLSRKDIRFAVRTLRRSAGFTSVALITLAVGIGATTAIFSVVNGVLLEALPYPESDRLVDISHTALGIGVERLPSAIGMHLVYAEGNRSFEEMALYSNTTANLTGGDVPEYVRLGLATPSMFRVLQVEAALGRTFTEQEGLPGGPSVVLLTHRFWMDRFGGSPDAIGRSLMLGGVANEVVGVLPEGFDFLSRELIAWRPFPIDPASGEFGGFNQPGLARLRPGVTPEQARADLAGLFPVVSERFSLFSPEMIRNAALTVEVRPYLDVVVGNVRTALWILMATVSFVLLIACANVANLLLVRAEGRQREVALRTAMGADRRHLYGQFLTESFILAGAGGLLGLGLAAQGLELLRSLGPQNLPRLHQIGLSGEVLLFTALVTIAATVVFGVIPVLRHQDSETAGALRDGSRGSTVSKGGQRARTLLVVSQVAFALMLLVGSGLMIRSFGRLHDVELGFDPAGVLTFRVALPSTSYPDMEATTAFHLDFVDRLGAIPGVEVAGASSFIPLSGFTAVDPLMLEERPPEPGQVPPVAASRAATRGYFDALGIPLRHGRMLERADAEQRQPVVVVSEQVVETFFEGRDPLGRGVAQGIPEQPDTWSQVVGVVGDVPYVSLTDAPMGTVYFPVGRADGVRGTWLSSSMDYVVRTPLPPTSLVPAVRRALAELDPGLPIANVRTLSDVTRGARAQMAFTMIMLAIAAAVGLLLGSVGLYGVISYVTTQRTQEIGVRMALGAEAGAVRLMVMRHGMAVTLAGIAVGLFGAWGLSRYMESVLYEVSATDPLTFFGVSAVLLAVAAVATWLPAYRAARIDPALALRWE